MPVNPQKDPNVKEYLYRHVRYDVECVARCEDDDARYRQRVRNALRRTDPVTYESEVEQLNHDIMNSDGPDELPDSRTMAHLSEWLSTAIRHKPFFNSQLSTRYVKAVRSFDEYDGWVEIPDLLQNWPPVTSFQPKFLEDVDYWLFRQHPSFQALLILAICEVVDKKTGLRKSRLQVKKIRHMSDGTWI